MGMQQTATAEHYCSLMDNVAFVFVDVTVTLIVQLKGLRVLIMKVG